MRHLVGRIVPARPDPLSLARKVADEAGFAFLWSAAGGGPSYIACWPEETARRIDPEPALGLVPRGSELFDFPRWIGALPYECRRSLERPDWLCRKDDRAPSLMTAPIWHRYGAVAKVTDQVLVGGESPALVDRLARRLAGPDVQARPIAAELIGVDSDEAHRARIVAALEWIRRGHIYQVNLARRFDLRLAGRAIDLLGALGRYAPAPFAAALELDGASVVSCSPELVLDLGADRRMRTAPIKGTRPRGRDAIADESLIRELDTDPKERAELAMVIDVERNDLGKVAEVDSVRLAAPPRVTTHRTVHHREAVVVARLRADKTRSELFEAMLPSGSVTGAPKIRAMELIADLEEARRGLYTGAFGYIRQDGGARLGMAIRTLTRRGEIAHYFAGGGIVADSEPDREVVETRWKALQLLKLLDHCRGSAADRPEDAGGRQNLSALS